MQIILGFIFGAVVGAVAHVVVRHRLTRGVVLGPMIGAVAGGGIWLLLTWVGITSDNPLLWLASIIVPALIVLPVLAAVSRARVARDRREQARLRIA